jgi:tRNA U34 5-methylaminomethyl-2-thiouridine-forming methyltransferase MnmC
MATPADLVADVNGTLAGLVQQLISELQSTQAQLAAALASPIPPDQQAQIDEADAEAKTLIGDITAALPPTPSP